jgi:tetratricopeptide (TPR) repeat protein
MDYVFFSRGGNVRGKDHGQCLTDETLAEYLEGNLDLAIRAVSEVHLVSCERCRDQLAFTMRVLQPEVTSEEASELEVIAAEWDKYKRVNELPRRKFKFFSRSWLAALGVVAVLMIGVVSIWFSKSHSGEPNSASEVVQLLLKQNRPFEARITGQPHRPILRTRGPDEAPVSFALLASEMTRLSASSYEMGRFYLLQKDFIHAIPYLQMAERESGVSAAVHNDLGVAYLESGSQDSSEKAEIEFEHALKLDSTFADAVFNLALLYERMSSPARAQTLWKQYLELDSKSDWAKEARDRLQALTR